MAHKGKGTTPDWLVVPTATLSLLDTVKYTKTLLLHPFYLLGNWGSEKINKAPNTKLVPRAVGAKTPVWLACM